MDSIKVDHNDASGVCNRFSDLYEQQAKNAIIMREGREAALHFQKLGMLSSPPPRNRNRKPGRPRKHE